MKRNGDEDFGENLNVVDEPDKRRLLERSVFEAPDKSFWKIDEKEPGSSHPGVCWVVDVTQRETVLFKGTSQQPKKSRYLNSYAIIEPNASNGLNALTYLRVDDPFTRGIQRVELLLHNRCRGKLSDDDVKTVEEALNELKGGKHGS